MNKRFKGGKHTVEAKQKIGAKSVQNALLALPDSVVFTKDSLHPLVAKRRFYKRTSNVCSKCGNDDNWQGQPLRLHVDHANGDRADCRIENLRKMCPNCHSQTETWGNKKRSLGKSLIGKQVDSEFTDEGSTPSFPAICPCSSAGRAETS